VPRRKLALRIRSKFLTGTRSISTHMAPPQQQPPPGAFGSLDCDSAGDHDQPSSFGWRPQPSVRKRSTFAAPAYNVAPASRTTPECVARLRQSSPSVVAGPGKHPTPRRFYQMEELQNAISRRPGASGSALGAREPMGAAPRAHWPRHRTPADSGSAFSTPIITSATIRLPSGPNRVPGSLPGAHLPDTSASRSK